MVAASINVQEADDAHKSGPGSLGNLSHVRKGHGRLHGFRWRKGGLKCHLLKSVVPAGTAKATLLRSGQAGRVGSRAVSTARTHPTGFHSSSQSGWGAAPPVGES